MNHPKQDNQGVDQTRSGHGPAVMGASTLQGNDVYNLKNEDLGDLKEIMIDMSNGCVAYAVLSFGGFMSMGEKLFAVPWSALTLDAAHKRFVLDVDKTHLERAPGFDKGRWPNMTDGTWVKQMHDFYGAKQPPATQV